MSAGASSREAQQSLAADHQAQGGFPQWVPATFVALLVFAGCSYLYFASRALDLDRHQTIVRVLSHAQALDTAITADTLQAHAGLHSNYDALARHTRALDETALKLRQLTSALHNDDPEGTADVHENMRRLERSLVQQRSLIERFKSRSAVYRNSLRYLSGLDCDAAPTGDGCPTGAPLCLEGACNELIRRVLVFDVHGTARLEAGVGESLHTLEQLQASDDNNEWINHITQHARTVLRTRADTREVLNEISNADSERAMEALLASYQVRYVDDLRAANRNRTILFVISIILIVYVVYAITRWRRATQMLAHANETLEERVRDRTREAERANRAKSNFLASMSHELRTPLNAIIGYSELLEEELSDDGRTHEVEDVRKIRGAGKHLLSLINDILDISKIEARKMEVSLDEFNVGDLVKEIETIVQPLMDQRNNRFIIRLDESLGSIYSDEVKVRQNLLNLLSNAAKFTDAKMVEFAITPAVREQRPGIAFRVSDEGIGMSDEQISRLFKPFAQAEATTRRDFGGTGLGLAITKRFTSMLGGQLRVESEVGHGSLFELWLPMRAPDLGPRGAGDSAITSTIGFG